MTINWQRITSLASIVYITTTSSELHVATSITKEVYIFMCLCKMGIFTLPLHSPAMKHKKTVANIFQ